LALPASALFIAFTVFPGGGDVERDVALAFELVALRHVAQQRADVDAFSCSLRVMALRLASAVTSPRNRALVELGRMRRDRDVAVFCVQLGVDLGHLQPAHLQLADRRACRAH
jgi:hypothetical protein